MPRFSLRTLVGTIGLAVAVAIFVAGPTGYFLVGYVNDAHELQFKSQLTAERLAKYIYRYRTLWQYQAPRLAELIELSPETNRNFAQEVRDQADKLVLRSGAGLTGPILVRSHPIEVAGTTFGRVDAMSSLLPLLGGTALVALASALLGFAAYFAVRAFPLRVLDQTLGALEKAQDDLESANAHLEEKNTQFDAALNNMTQGLCMFDASGRLQIANRRFAEMFKISAEQIARRPTVAELLQVSQSSEGVALADQGRVISQHRQLLEFGEDGTILLNLTDGRTILASQRNMADGGFVTTFDDVTERRRAEERVQYLAHFDALTGLPNRSSFYEQIEGALPHMRRGETLAVLSVDLDHFKNVNDTLGHPIGDLLLKAAAERMRQCVREQDIIGRVGGDEFAIVQLGSEQPHAVTTLARRVVDTVGAVYDLGDHQVVIGASIGIAFAPGDGTDADQLVKNADLAMYRAKTDGGGTYRFFEPQMDARMQARRALELDLRRAVLNHEFTLEFQPLISLKSGRITSLEALIRWNHPQRGTILPTEFIPVAEETALIVPISEWVLRQACKEAMNWGDHITLSVNLSPVQFNSTNLVQTVVSALAESRLPAHRLELEITELVLLQDNEATFTTLHELRDLGVRIAMDDFGTGYSSLGYLRKFPFDKIKIDQSFIRDVDTRDESLAIVRAVVGLGSSLGIVTTAEGVETSAQLERLRSEGCTEVQGHLFSPPRPASEIRAMLKELQPGPQAVA